MTGLQDVVHRLHVEVASRITAAGGEPSFDSTMTGDVARGRLTAHNITLKTPAFDYELTKSGRSYRLIMDSQDYHVQLRGSAKRVVDAAYTFLLRGHVEQATLEPRVSASLNEPRRPAYVPQQVAAWLPL